MSYLVEDLLTSAKKRSFAPISQTTFQDDSLIEIANDELLLELVSDIMQVREDFFLAQRDVAIVSGVDRYALPERSIGNALKAVFFKDSSGNLSQPLTRIDVDRSDVFSGLSGIPSRFYFEGDEIVVLPSPTSSGYITQSYYQRPNRLVATSDCAKITAINQTTSSVTFTVNTDQSANWTTADDVDILSAKSPFLLWSKDCAIEAITASTIQVALSGVVNQANTVEPQVGDYICLAQTANIPMLPVEFHMILAQMIACAMLHSLGQVEKLQAAEGRLQRMRQKAGLLIKNRAESSPEMLVQRNNLARTFSR